MKSERGSISMGVLLVFIIGLAVVLGYVLLNKDNANTDVTVVGTGAIDITYNNTSAPSVGFTDGLNQPSSSETFPLDEVGEGTEKKEVFNVDINSDGLMDRIVRTHNENGTAHFWDEYRIELNNNGVYFNIAPSGLRTTEGAECALQKVKFVFKPKFKVIKISRPWDETWNTPTMATRTVYELRGNKLVATSVQELKKVCDVSELFNKL